MARHKYFNAWLVDALADLVMMQRELDDAKRGWKDAEETRKKCFSQEPRGGGDKLLRVKIEYAILNYQTASESERLRLLVDKCETCVRLQRERIVQAWHRHVQRSLKRISGRSDMQARAEWRRIAGLYAIFCMVDNYETVRGNPYISYVYEETVKRIASFKFANPV